MFLLVKMMVDIPKLSKRKKSSSVPTKKTTAVIRMYHAALITNVHVVR